MPSRLACHRRSYPVVVSQLTIRSSPGPPAQLLPPGGNGSGPGGGGDGLSPSMKSSPGPPEITSLPKLPNSVSSPGSPAMLNGIPTYDAAGRIACSGRQGRRRPEFHIKPLCVRRFGQAPVPRTSEQTARGRTSRLPSPRRRLLRAGIVHAARLGSRDGSPVILEEVKRLRLVRRTEVLRNG
jgi:hypothetical protein